MIGAVFLLALAALGAAPPTTASSPPPAEAETLATRLLEAPEAGRSKLLDEAGFASVEVARALVAMGDKAVLDADYARALASFRLAETVARRVGSEPDVATALGGAARTLFRQGEFQPAKREAEASLRLFERLGDKAGQAEAWNSIGTANYGLGDTEASLAAVRHAYDLWTAVGDRRGVARALNNFGALSRNIGRLDEAVSYFEQALRVFEELDDRRSAAVVTNTIGLVHFDRGEYPLAVEYCRRSLAMREALGDRYGVSSSLDSLGNIARVQGAYARALDFHHRSLKLRLETGDRFGAMETWNNIGLVHFAQGEYALAIDAYKRGLRLNAALGGSSMVSEGLANIAAAAWRMGDRGRAEANYRESLHLSEKGGYRALTASSLLGLGRMALDGHRPGEANALLERALAIGEALKDQAGTAEALNGLAAVKLASGHPEDALALAQRAAAIAREFEQRETLWEAATLAGLAQRDMGRTDAARRSLEEAVAVIEGLRLEVAGSERAGERFFESKLSPYHELMALALARGSPGEALELAERSKARVLADIVQKGRVDIKGTMSETDRREEERLRDAVVSLNTRIQAERQKGRPDAGRLDALESDRKAKRSAFEAFQAALEAKQPELQLQRGRAQSYTMGEAGSLLPDGSVAVLEYAVTEENSYLFVLTRDEAGASVQAYTLGAGRSSLASRCSRFRERLAARDLGFPEDARALYDLLVAPARAQLKGKTRIIVVPDGPLWDVPFQALQDGAGGYVIQSAAVSYTPSLTVLREAVRRPRSSGAPTVLAMGKSDFGAKGERPAVSLMSDLGPLPDAERQVRLIAEIYGPDRSATYVGAEAREDRFKAEAPRYSILHLATHGLLDQAAPLYSNVVLSPGSTGSSEDGLLEAWELMDLRLKADLVILSACETGRGRIAPGEGIVGMMWAAFVAGSQALLVSQWKVDSASTTELMTAFHAGLARGDGGGKAELLQRASLAVLQKPRYAHPFYWAGFILVGNPY